MSQEWLMKNILAKLGYRPTPTITMAEHVRIVAEKVGEARKDLLADVQQERETAGRLLGKNVALRSEVAELSAKLGEAMSTISALRPDAEKYRERCRRDREHAENARVRKRAARKEVA